MKYLSLLVLLRTAFAGLLKLAYVPLRGLRKDYTPALQTASQIQGVDVLLEMTNAKRS